MKNSTNPERAEVALSSLFSSCCSSVFFPFSSSKTSTEGQHLKRVKKTSRQHKRVQERLAFLEKKNLVKKGEHKKNESSSKLQFCNASGILGQKAGSNTQLMAVVQNSVLEKCACDTETTLTSLSAPYTVVPAVNPQCSHLKFCHSCDCCPLSSPVPSNVGVCSLTVPTKYVALDCEMVGTGPGGKVNELARCSIVNHSGDVVYDKYVKPTLPITDYRTRWSGIRKEHMEKAVPFKVAQKEILKILKGKVLVGHALHNDFMALHYIHPTDDIRDTSKMPLLNKKAGLCVTEKVSLKRLTKLLLHRDIQVGREGHSSVEDAQASMDLYKLVEVQWEWEFQNQFTKYNCYSHISMHTTSSYLDDQYWPEDLNKDCK
ncbi:apoptosis-enhancing nuclease-like isoform X2 [Protopterus annectens]|nr:apoptosis-enhancing nuclease-like isoform X2 [Protopterus annectens]XP_043934283.1 apoptosis-enhancing nuclease-like isoform X2 [Protopterus annectens]